MRSSAGAPDDAREGEDCPASAGRSSRCRAAVGSRANGDLGRAIRGLRCERDVSIEALAFAAGIHPTYLSSIERGLRNPSWRVVRSQPRARWRFRSRTSRGVWKEPSGCVRASSGCWLKSTPGKIQTGVRSCTAKPERVQNPRWARRVMTSIPGLYEQRLTAFLSRLTSAA